MTDQPGSTPPPYQPPQQPQPGYPAGAVPPPGAGLPPQPPYVQPQLPVVSQAEAKGFFGALFDFSFSHFIALRVVKIVYIIYIVLLALQYLAAIIVGFSFNAGIGVVALIFFPVFGLIYLALFRLFLEFIVATVRTAENTTKLAAG